MALGFYLRKNTARALLLTVSDRGVYEGGGDAAGEEGEDPQEVWPHRPHSGPPHPPHWSPVDTQSTRIVTCH
jgi:hypothetical protein